MRKGQLTLYIIMGLIFVISAIFILTIKEKQTISEQDTVLRVVQDTPETLKPLKIYVEECIQSVATEGIIRLGMQGGYVDISGLDLLALRPTESEAVDFFGDGSMTIPYWWYLASDDDTQNYRFDSKRPALYRSGGADSFEVQLDRHIEDNLLDCLDFDEFRDFQVEWEKDPVARVTLRQADVLAQVYFPLKIRYQEVVSEVELFDSILDVALPGIYDTATNIVNFEMNSSVFGIYTMNLIAAFSGLDREMLPPTDASSFDPSDFTFWTLSRTRDKIEQMLMVYVPMLQVYGSLNYNFNAFDNDLAESLYAMRILPSYGTDVADFVPYEIDFTYLDLWPAYLDLEGRGVMGELIGPERATVSFFPWVAINRFQIYYDLSYPMVVQIHDPRAFNGRGFSLFFAIEVNVRDNYPIDTSRHQAFEIDDQPGSMFCNMNMRKSGIYDIRAYDLMTNESVPDIPVYYSCGETCMIGITDSDGRFRTRLPICYGGRISTQSYDFWSEPIKINAILEQNQDIDIGMYRIAELESEVKKKSVTKSGTEWTLMDAELFLNSNAESIVFIKKIKRDPHEQTLTSSFFAKGDDLSFGTVRLVPGEYEVNIMNILYERVSVPEGEICVDTGMIISNEECTTLDRIDFQEPFPYGGLELDNAYYNATGVAVYWNITEEDVYGNTKITFFTLAMPDDIDSLTHMDLELLGLVGEFSARYRDKVEPRFS